ncbi:MAG: murein biosynthesis integral membrane protein MurJ [Elusimicrobia bacterium]|nr:murein biosynthesis integral membrane protein MurJ [Elusimicrobiota bacterium]
MGQGSGGRNAFLVAAGILCSRLMGLVRLRVFAHYFGLSDSADAFNAAFRIPNLLQNLFGEGALSASFIPVYSSLRARGQAREADRVAGAVASLLALGVSVLVLAGVLAAPWLVAAIAPGFEGPKRELTVELVRVLFPGAGLLVLSAWCLGVLNSHGKFLLSYAAPVVWNLAMIATMVYYGGAETARLAVLLAWGSVAGSALQLLVQVPAVLRNAPDLAFAIDAASAHVRAVGANFAPVLVSRGVVQLSAYIDELFASKLPTGAMAGIASAQLLYTLPVSLFGLSVAAAELPTMSGVAGAEGGRDELRRRLQAGLRRIAFFVIPSAIAFLTLGDVIAAALFETGRFRRADSLFVWSILGGSSIGLLASTWGRLYSSTYYALRDTRTPLRYALVHVGLATVLGWVFAFPLPRALGLEASWGAGGLTLSAGIAAWVELFLLRRALGARLGDTRLPPADVARLWGCALAAAAVAWGVKLGAPGLHPIAAAAAILGPYGAVYFGTTYALGVPESAALLRRLASR